MPKPDISHQVGSQGRLLAKTDPLWLADSGYDSRSSLLIVTHTAPPPFQGTYFLFLLFLQLQFLPGHGLLGSEPPVTRPASRIGNSMSKLQHFPISSFSTYLQDRWNRLRNGTTGGMLGNQLWGTAGWLRPDIQRSV